MFCSNCGNQFEGKFCPECGTPVAGQASTVNLGSGEQEQIKAVLALYEPYKKLYRAFAEYVTYQVELEGLVLQRERALETNYVEQTEKSSGALKKLGKAALATYTFGASLAVSSALKHHNKNKDEKTNEIMKGNMVATIDVNIRGTQERCELKENEIENILSDREFQKARLELPEECCDYDTIMFFDNAIKSGRADTWKELINLYHDELYKTEMIENSRVQLEMLETGVRLQQEVVDITYGILQETVEIKGGMYGVLQETAEIKGGVYGLQQETEAGKKELLRQALQTNEFMQSMNHAMEREIKQTIKLNRNVKKARRGIFFNSLITFFK